MQPGDKVTIIFEDRIVIASITDVRPRSPVPERSGIGAPATTPIPKRPDTQSSPTPIPGRANPGASANHSDPERAGTQHTISVETLDTVSK